jgi:LemA protein
VVVVVVDGGDTGAAVPGADGAAASARLVVVVVVLAAALAALAVAAVVVEADSKVSVAAARAAAVRPAVGRISGLVSERLQEYAMSNVMRRSRHVAILIGLTTSLAGCSYNRFTTQEEAIKAQWAQVQNQLQRRNDLIPNLVETVRGYATHEESVFKEIADSRSRLLAAQTPEQTIQAANQQTAALGRLLAVVESYPQLRANEQFNRLMDELAGTENRIAVERQRYNERIQEYNTLRRRFPSNVTAKVFGFKEYPYFEAPPSAQAPPKVDFRK